ncbi:methyltransferase domain-containing protein [Roseivirga thermotolerans]|uniref:SAM-dependent methyltransferase n=1 Tax=Roseivirga thermotolerans TaxID=1758176 RepID=A0ABQ3I6T6_9BACT|nr:methyltransferase domain-containing protein [Roseivirga thermotolerans]GHE68834.1 SAM-dependent methyltransferase [Roseivirga thermotolerans]
MELGADYWDKRYETGATGWDIGHVSTPLKAYFDQLQDKSLQILIPGAGNAYEAEYLWQMGFKNVFVVDISEKPLRSFAERVGDFPKDQLIHADFFALKGDYDVIVEQTFFCALSPDLRPAYVTQCGRLLKNGGKLVGLLFRTAMNSDRPPFGGSKEEYVKLFSESFILETMELAVNSIEPRAGNELFIKLLKK